MADFFTDSDDDKAVEELLSLAMDATVLEQVSAINCAGFTDSDLPSHLETRFQKLKSFPSSTVKPSSLSSRSFHHSNSPEFRKNKTADEPDSCDEKMPTTCLTKSPDENGCLSDSGSLSPFKKIPFEKKGTKSSKSFRKNQAVNEAENLESSEEKMPTTCLTKSPQGKFEKKGAKSPSFSSREGSVSPPAKIGCFLCSPKKVSRKKSKGNRGLDWGNDDEFLSDVSNFSVNQRKLIKKAMEEEEKICREAEKIVKLAKQASARMDVSGIEDELSDEENHKFH